MQWIRHIWKVSTFGFRICVGFIPPCECTSFRMLGCCMRQAVHEACPASPALLANWHCISMSCFPGGCLAVANWLLDVVGAVCLLFLLAVFANGSKL